MVGVLECEAIVLRSINSSGELKSVYSMERQYVLVGIVGYGDVLFMNLKI